MNSKRDKHKRIFYLPMALVSLFVFLLVACQTKETELPFEMVEKGNITLYEQQEDSGVRKIDMDLLIFTSHQQAQQFSLQPKMNIEPFADVDFDKDFVIVAYFGAAPRGGFELTIEEITQIGKMVNVVISTVEPEHGDAVETHPLHAVIIRKNALQVGGNLTFNLRKDDELILSREHFVP